MAHYPRAILLLLAMTAVATRGVETDTMIAPRCKDCWCLPADGQACPDSAGLTQSYPASWVNALRSFVREDDEFSAALPAVDDCFPFDGLDVNAAMYPQSTLPVCEAPVQTADSVCAFVFDEPDVSCTGRTYRVQTFASQAAWSAATANVTHSLMIHDGACGVCSNAADMAARVDTLLQMDDIVILCATDYLLSADRNTRFETLTQCFQTNAALSAPCAVLWAHFAAANAFLCPDDCIPTADNQVIYNDPDTCALTECIQCSATVFEDAFNALAGLWKSAQNAGWVDSIIYTCDSYPRMDTFDPCVGAILDATATSPPTTTPPSGVPSRRTTTALSVWTVVWVLGMVKKLFL